MKSVVAERTGLNGAKEVIEPLAQLSRDLKAAASTLSFGEARFLVDSYYSWQEERIRADAQIRTLSAESEPHDVLGWLSGNADMVERSIKRALGVFADQRVVGRWAQLQVGVGPVIAAGLLAHIDIERAPTVGHIWRFAGLDPTARWEKGQKRPWNARLKVVCWKLGESFVKQSGKPDAYYGQVYAARKLLELERDAEGMFAEQAAAALAAKRFGKETEAYKAYSKGHLPPAHLHARAKRYAVKLFLAHLHHVWYEHRYGTPPPKPYVIEQLGHAHLLAPPGWPMS